MIENIIFLLTGNWIGVIITFICVMFVLNFSTSKLEEQLSTIGKKIKIPNGIRGATLDAVSSSLPELLTAMIGLILLKEKGLEIGIGTISGSAIFNILIIPFFALLFYKGKGIIKISKNGINRDVVFYILSIFIFLGGLYLNELFIMGFVLVILYLFYLYVLYYQSKIHKIKNLKEVNEAYSQVKNKKISYFTIIYTLVFIYIGVELSVHSAEFIGNSLGISTLVVALVMLASITSIPDTLLSIKSAKKGNIDASLSNAVGSNIFDICIGLGVPIMIGIGFMGLNPEVNFWENFSIFVFLLLSVFVYLGILGFKKITKKSGYYLLLLYLFFIGYLIYISIY